MKAKLLEFAFIYFSKSRLFNELQRMQTIKFGPASQVVGKKSQNTVGRLLLTVPESSTDSVFRQGIESEISVLGVDLHFLLPVTAERDRVVGVSQVLAQQVADRLATRRVGPLGQARIEIEFGRDAVECDEEGEDVDHQWFFQSNRLANRLPAVVATRVTRVKLKHEAVQSFFGSAGI
jgi:hypothetical protein